jgi:hypothetical protein
VYLLFKSSSKTGVKRISMLVLSGFCAALSSLTNGMGILLVLYGPLAIYMFEVCGEKPKEKAKSAALFLAGFIFLFLLSVLFVKTNAAVFFSKLPLLDKGTGSMVVAYFKNLYFRLFVDIGDLVGWTIGVFVLLGILIIALGENTKKQIAFIALGILIFIVLAVFKHNRFHSFIMILVYIPLAVNTFGSGAYKKVLEKRLALVLLLVFTVLAFISIFNSLNKIGRIAKGEPKHLIEIANYMIKNAEKRSGLISKQALLPRRIGFTHIPIPEGVNDLRGLLQYAREKGAGYLLADFPEYNTYPFLRFLSDPGMKSPLGLREFVRKDYSALYELDFSMLETKPGKPYSGRVPYQWIQLAKHSAIKPDSTGTPYYFINQRLRIKDPAKMKMPAHQFVRQYKMDGYLQKGIIFRGAFNEIVTANIYVPDLSGIMSPSIQADSLAPAAIVLPGQDREGKASTLAMNYGETLARLGYYVITLDWPGTGERVGPGWSHIAAMPFQAASGYAPAEIFIYETLLAKNLFGLFAGLNTAKVNVVAIGDDAFTALYTAVLDTAIHSITFVGGLVPFESMLGSNPKVSKALINGIAGRYSVGDLLNDIRHRKLQLVCMDSTQNSWGKKLERQFGMHVLYAAAQDAFVKENFEKSIIHITESTQLQPGASGIRMKNIDPRQKQTTFTIGERNLNAISPRLLEIARNLVTVRNDSLARDPLRAGYTQAATQVIEKTEVRGNRVACKIIVGSTLPAAWTEIKLKNISKINRVIIFTGGHEAELNTDSGFVKRALDRGYTVCQVSLFDQYGGYRDVLSRIYDYTLSGLALRDRLEEVFKQIKSYYQVQPDYFAQDWKGTLAGLGYLETHPSDFKQVFIQNLIPDAIDRLYSDVYQGYDGAMHADAEHVSLNNLYVSLMIQSYGTKNAGSYFELIERDGGWLTLYFDDPEDVGYDEYPKDTRIVTQADSVFIR